MSHFMHKLFNHIKLYLEIWSGLPTWLLTWLFVSLIPKHPWKPFPFKLVDWSLGRSALCKSYDVIFWIGIPLWLGAAYGLAKTQGWL